MAWAPLLLTLLAHCTGATSQAVVTQESLLSTTPGGTVTLTCGTSAGAVTTNNYANWVQQKPYQVPRGLIGGTSNRAPGVPARFSGSLLGNKAALTITGAQPEDEAEYYCALWHSNHFHSDRCSEWAKLCLKKQSRTRCVNPKPGEEHFFCAILKISYNAQVLKRFHQK